MGKSSPATPDYKGAAEATAAGSKEVTNAQTYANRPTQTNPWGTSTWGTSKGVDPSTGKAVTEWTQNQTLNETSQNALDSQLAVQQGRSDLGAGMIGSATNELQNPMDWDQYGEMRDGPQAEGTDQSQLYDGVGSVNAGTYDKGHDEYRNEAENALYDRSSTRLDTRFGQGQNDIEVKLAGQGLAPGDEAYDREMKNFNDSRNDAYSSAQNDAITFGGEEASRNFGMDLASGGQQYSEELGAGNFANAARAQSLSEQTGIKDRDFNNATMEANNANALRTGRINEEQQERQSSLNEMNAVLSGQQVNPANMAAVNMAGRAQGTNYTGAMQDTYAADLNRSNASNMGMQGLMGGISGLGGLF